uniref:Uncharacterized protein n=1 Tax=Moniliophthora roreri TaxID=221103 RepID=A0A0W0FIV7_MONRR
MLGNRGLS